MRAYTPREQRAVKAAAETFRPNPEIDTERVILELGVGEALVSTLEKKGEPSIVQRTLIRPPSSRLGPLTAEERKAVIDESPVKGVYDETLDRDSAHEILQRRTSESQAGSATGEQGYEQHGEFRIPKPPGQNRESSRSSSGTSRRDTPADAFFKSLARSIGTVLPRILERVLRGRYRR